jgi:HNH endonuclease
MGDRFESFGGRFVAFSKTRRGIATNLLAVIFAIVAVSALATEPQGGTSAGGVIVAVIVGVPVGWGVARLAVYTAEHLWEERTAPAIPPFARRRPSAAATAMLRRDPNAGFWQDRGGFLWARRHWFAGTGCWPVRFARAEFIGMGIHHRQGTLPTPVVRRYDRQWWWWQDAFYWDTGDYSASDVKALLLQRERRKQRELEHAHTMMAQEESPEPRKREPIPEDVQRLVFRRDEGRCQQCGSKELLQFDHVIPFSMSGSNEPENLQLLCSRCNREKGGVL